MRIKEISFEDKTKKWKLEKTEFSDLTLLVGISGVGKTKILNSIATLRDIANGKSVNGVKWNVLFTSNEGVNYCWEGEFENVVRPEYAEEPFQFLQNKTKEKNTAKIISEKLSRDNIIIAERTKAGIKLGGNKTPKLSPFTSILSLLSEEDSIKPAYNSLRSITTSEFSVGSVGFYFSPSYELELEKKPSLEEIRESRMPTEIQIALIYKLAKPFFRKIKSRFIEVFPQVTDVRFESVKNEKFSNIRPIPILQIKELGVKGWIDQFNISSGMYKSFMLISELFLLPSGTVVLIDEFENSLGVNCIDILTEDILHESRNLQFIVTSHHPYIINNIPTKHWKIVTRRGGVVTTRDSKNLGFDKSKHKAFLQLLNLEQYTNGVYNS